MPITNFPGGLGSFGVPILGGGSIPATTGKYIFVHHTGANNNTGEDTEYPVASLQGAFTRAAASEGDIIVLMPGHAERVSTASALNLNKAGIYITGLGYGANRPTITLDTAATSTITVSAANITIDNVIFSANFADIVSTITLGTAANFRVQRCAFLATAVNMNFLHVFDTGTVDNSCDGLTFVNCFWHEPDAATLAFGLVDCAIANLEISDNVLVNGNATLDTAALLTIATGKNLTGARILRNNIDVTGNASSTAGVFITTDGTAHTGVIAYNNVKHLDNTTEVFITATHTFGLFENRATAVANAQGYLLPAVDS